LIGSDASFAQEIIRPEQRDGCFLALFGDHAEPYSPLLNVIRRDRRLSLRKDDLLRAIPVKSPADFQRWPRIP